MRTLFFLTVFCFCWSGLVAQAPQSFKYQAVARDASGVIMANKSVSFKISILFGNTIGPSVYTETHIGKTTNGFGLIDLEIGNGTPVSGTFASITWSNGPYFIKIEMDPAGGSTYQVIGVSQFLSVPYALYAKSAGSNFSGNYNDLTNKPEGSKIGDMQYWGGSKWELVPPGLNGQVLRLMNGVPVWSAGPPLISTIPVSNITSGEATCGGVIISDAGDSITTRGVCWSTSPFPTIMDFKTVNGAGRGSFASNLTGLMSNTVYYTRAYAINSLGIGYGNQLTFTSEKILTTPIVTTSSAISITATSATLGGNVTDDGNSPVIERGVVYGTTQTPTFTDFRVTIGSGKGSFSSTVTGLSSNTTYYVRAYAINGMGTSFGSLISFTTSIVLNPPTVVTTAALNITASSATLGGNVISDGNATVTERGIVYSTSTNPTVLNSKIAMGTGTGLFNQTVTGLSGSTTYYARAYAINSQGTAYGSQISFITLEASSGTFTDIRDGHIYTWARMGTQVWMSENLTYLPSVVSPTISSDTLKYFYVYGYTGTDVAVAKASPNFATYGVLYNWVAAKTACPVGWHLPSDAEWKTMEVTLGMTQGQADAGNWRGTTQGTMMKSTSYWNSNGNGTNSSGFDGRPAGYRFSPGGFSGTALLGYWWSSTEYSASYAWHRSLYYDFTTVYRGTDSKSCGFSVRCVRD
jgi:uncharacterized protein (TIGR02145 family)